MNIIKITCFKFALPFILFVFSAACASYSNLTTSMISEYEKKNLEKALKKSKAVKEKANKKDIYLVTLERGKIALGAGEYELAIKEFDTAETRYLDIEGTISIPEEFSSVFASELSKEYMPESYEILMISPYLILSYLGMQDIEGAIVERNRTMTKINQYIESTERREIENPFARYLSAFMYEKEGLLDDATIEYRKILKTYPEEKLAKNMLKKIENGENVADDIIFFFDCGRAPVKIEKKEQFLIGTIYVNVAYPEYKQVKSRISHIRILADNTEIARSQMVYQVSETVLSHFKKQQKKIKEKIAAKTAARVTAQAAGTVAREVGKNLRDKRAGLITWLIGAAVDAGAKISSALEQADLRSWLTLPNHVQMLRLDNVDQLAPALTLQCVGKNGTILEEISLALSDIIKSGEIYYALFPY